MPSTALPPILLELMPITSPRIFKSAPPELPGLMAASVCMNVPSVPSESSILLFNALITPVVTDCPYPRGERYIDQMCFFDRYEGKNAIYMLVEDGKQVSDVIPDDILRRLHRAGIEEPFHCPQTCAYEPLDISLVKASRKSLQEVV